MESMKENNIRVLDKEPKVFILCFFCFMKLLSRYYYWHRVRETRLVTAEQWKQYMLIEVSDYATFCQIFLGVSVFSAVFEVGIAFI